MAISIATQPKYNLSYVDQTFYKTITISIKQKGKEKCWLYKSQSCNKSNWKCHLQNHTHFVLLSYKLYESNKSPCINNIQICTNYMLITNIFSHEQ